MTVVTGATLVFIAAILGFAYYAAKVETTERWARGLSEAAAHIRLGVESAISARIVSKPGGAELAAIEEAHRGPFKPIPKVATRADFPSEEAWLTYQSEMGAVHFQARLEAAKAAWKLEMQGEPPEDEALLAWHLGTAKQDGAANAKALKEWDGQLRPCLHGGEPCSTPDRLSRTGYAPTGFACLQKPTDQQLVAWLRKRREESTAPEQG